MYCFCTTLPINESYVQLPKKPMVPENQLLSPMELNKIWSMIGGLYQQPSNLLQSNPNIPTKDISVLAGRLLGNAMNMDNMNIYSIISDLFGIDTKDILENWVTDSVFRNLLIQDLQDVLKSLLVNKQRKFSEKIQTLLMELNRHAAAKKINKLSINLQNLQRPTTPTNTPGQVSVSSRGVVGLAPNRGVVPNRMGMQHNIQYGTHW